MEYTVDGLLHQRNLLVNTLRDLLVAYEVVNPDMSLSGPELILAAETVIIAKKKLEN